MHARNQQLTKEEEEEIGSVTPNEPVVLINARCAFTGSIRGVSHQRIRAHVHTRMYTFYERVITLTGAILSISVTVSLWNDAFICVSSNNTSRFINIYNDLLCTALYKIHITGIMAYA